MENSINTYRIRYLKDTSLQTAYVQGKDQKEATKGFLDKFADIQAEKVLSVENIQETKEEYDISKIIKIAASIFIALIGVYGIYLGWNSYKQMSSNEDAKHTYPSYTKKETINTFYSKKRSDPESERRKDLIDSNSYSSSRDSFMFPKVFNSAEKSRCFEYDKPYAFKGKIVKKVYYDDETGNHNYLALELDKPICTLPKEYSRRESEITHMQISSGGSNMVQKLEGKHVELKGSLYHSDNAHHFTKVLISLKSIERKESGHTSANGKDSISPEFTNATMTQKTKEESMATGHKPVRTLKGHKDTVVSVTFSPDGSTIASGSYDKTIKLWDTQSGRLLNTLKGHTNIVVSLAFSPDSSMIVSGSYDKTVKLWDTQSGRLLNTFKNHKHKVHSVAFSPDGTTIASGSWDGTIKLWDIQNGRLLNTLKNHSSLVLGIAFSPDGTKIVSGSGDNTIKLWDTQSGKLLNTLKSHTENIYCMASSPDGNMIALGNYDGIIKLWDTQNGRLLNTFKSHTSTILCISFSPDGTKIVSGSGDNTIKLWDTKNGRLLSTLKGHKHNIGSVIFNPSGTMIASGSYDKTIKLWNINPYIESLAKKGFKSIDNSGKDLDSKSALSPVSTFEDEHTLVSKGHGKMISSSDKGAIIHTARVEKMIDLPDESGIKVSMMSIDTGGSTDVSATKVIFFTLYKRGEEYSTDASFELGYFFSLESAKKVGNGSYRFMAKSASKSNGMPVMTTFVVDAGDAISALDNVKCNGHMDCSDSTNFKTTIKLLGEHEKQDHEVQAKNTVNTFAQEKTFNKETTTYYARISQKDHYGKSGQKLKSVGIILQQDRANYHKYHKRDREDTGDNRFDTRDNRNKIQRMLARGSTSQKTLDAIRYGTPLVKVKIYPEYIDVTLESGGGQTQQRQEKKNSAQTRQNKSKKSKCNTDGSIRGISRSGDGFVAVRKGPGTKYGMIGKIYRNGTRVKICDRKGKWKGVIYGDCISGSSRSPNGSCKAGWVYEKYIK